MGMKSFSFRDVKRRIVMKRKADKEPDGIVKLWILRFMNVACSMLNVVICE